LISWRFRGFHIDFGDITNEVGIDISTFLEIEILNNNIHFTSIGVRNVNTRNTEAYTLIRKQRGL